MTRSAAEYVAPSSLIPWAGNPRINDGSIDKVAASIQEFGFASPIIARLEDREIIAGHTRWAAACKLGLTEVPVRFMDISSDKAHALALADNKLGELADWDIGLLTSALGEIQDTLGDDLAELAGWDNLELDVLFPPTAVPNDSQSEEDSPQPESVVDNKPVASIPVSKSGETFHLSPHTLHCGDCVEVMKELPANSVDSIVTDPPYGIGFMGKGWDHSVPSADFAEQAFRVLKPGGHIVAFAATRTVHRLAVALEDAGLEIRDQFAWLQWQGFPKSQPIGKFIDKYLGKERKVLGVDSAWTKRVGSGVSDESSGFTTDTFGSTKGDNAGRVTVPATELGKAYDGWGTALKPAFEPAVLARKPLEGTVAANTVKHGVGGMNIEDCRIPFGDAAWPQSQGHEKLDQIQRQGETNEIYMGGARAGDTWATYKSGGRWPANIYYCPKASRSEREAGCGELATDDSVGNSHPTVKPIELMRWLVRLLTPPNGTVLEPFCGSGTTLVAAQLEGMKCIAIEKQPEYCDIIQARLREVQ